MNPIYLSNSVRYNERLLLLSAYRTNWPVSTSVDKLSAGIKVVKCLHSTRGLHGHTAVRIMKHTTSPVTCTTHNQMHAISQQLPVFPLRDLLPDPGDNNKDQQATQRTDRSHQHHRCDTQIKKISQHHTRNHYTQQSKDKYQAFFHDNAQCKQKADTNQQINRDSASRDVIEIISARALCSYQIREQDTASGPCWN